MPDNRRTLTGLFPTYTRARHYLRIVDGVPHRLFREMNAIIWAQRGTPQQNVDWSDPDAWIPERLVCEEAELATRIWKESEGQLNPRHLRGCWMLSQHHGLLALDELENLRVTPRGWAWLDEPGGAVEAEIDTHEGVLHILALLAAAGVAPRGALLVGFASFCRARTTYASDSVIHSALAHRLRNLVDRGLVARGAARYQITVPGQRYLDRYVVADAMAVEPRPAPSGGPDREQRGRAGVHMTRAQRALQIWQVLIGAAHNRQLLTYPMVAERIGMATQGLAPSLALVSAYCAARALPPLTVLVVGTHSGQPGEGLDTVSDVGRDREAVFTHNWYAMVPVTAEELAEP